MLAQAGAMEEVASGWVQVFAPGYGHTHYERVLPHKEHGKARWENIVQHVASMLEAPAVVTAGVLCDISVLLPWWLSKKAARWASLKATVLALFKLHYRHCRSPKTPLTDASLAGTLRGVTTTAINRAVRVLRNSGLFSIEMFCHTPGVWEVQNVLSSVIHAIPDRAVQRRVYKQTMAMLPEPVSRVSPVKVAGVFCGVSALFDENPSAICCDALGVEPLLLAKATPVL